ncbi:hypothetical protein PR048_017806 [Dryococelus australis]|uniref:Uncharacterized protein n=1 Tax=Dryococelus australis TaxID=614101 RepID=A0ABQ9HAK0_9NEOP|nr:hypothetical protein PR048_017806 [Dryococelus australis]
MQGRGKREIPEKTRRPTASSGMIPTCENPVTRRISLPDWFSTQLAKFPVLASTFLRVPPTFSPRTQDLWTIHVWRPRNEPPALAKVRPIISPRVPWKVGGVISHFACTATAVRHGLCNPLTSGGTMALSSAARTAPSQVVIVPDDVAGRRVFSGISRFPHPFIQALLRTHLASPSSAFKSSILMVLCTETFSVKSLFAPECVPRVKCYDGNTARLAHRSDEALGVRVSIARIAPSPIDTERAAAEGETPRYSTGWRVAFHGDCSFAPSSSHDRFPFGSVPREIKAIHDKYRDPVESTPNRQLSAPLCLTTWLPLSCWEGAFERRESSRWFQKFSFHREQPFTACRRAVYSIAAAPNSPRHTP